MNKLTKTIFLITATWGLVACSVPVVSQTPSAMSGILNARAPLPSLDLRPGSKGDRNIIEGVIEIPRDLMAQWLQTVPGGRSGFQTLAYVAQGSSLLGLTDIRATLGEQDIQLEILKTETLSDRVRMDYKIPEAPSGNNQILVISSVQTGFYLSHFLPRLEGNKTYRLTEPTSLKTTVKALLLSRKARQKSKKLADLSQEEIRSVENLPNQAILEQKIKSEILNQNPSNKKIIDLAQVDSMIEDALANGSTNGSTNGNANGSTNGNANGSTNGSTNGNANSSTNGSTNGNANSSTNGNANSSTNGSTNGNANGSTNGNANGSTNGNANSSTNGNANSSTNGSTNGNANGSTNGNANSSTNGNANGNANSSTNGNANSSTNGNANSSTNGNANGNTDSSTNGNANSGNKKDK